MEVGRPTWETKQICPCCGQCYPTFCYCTKCGFVTLRCDEMGDLFKNPKDLNEGMIDKCPNCGQEEAMDFETADSDRILNAGFTKEDYE